MTTLPKAEAEGEPHPGKNNEKEEKLYNRDRKKRKFIISSKPKIKATHHGINAKAQGENFS